MASNYPLGYDDERFESIVNQHFHCLICYDVLKEPVICRRNEHYFCRGCITEHLRTNSHKCPTCADELSVETLQDVPRIVKNYLNELSIRCNHYDRGCREHVQLQNLKRHVAECGFTPVVCGNQGCGETISKRDRTYHESELCQFRKLKCHNCGEISTREKQHIFVAGGAGRNSVEIYNCRGRLWSLLKSMPENRSSAPSSFVYDNHVTVAGGVCLGRGVDNMIRMNIHPVPDLSINWSDCAAKLPARMPTHSSVVYKDSLLVTGGINADQGDYSDCIHEVQLKPPYTVKLVSKMPEQRIRHSTELCDDSILIVGGKKSRDCKDNLSSVLSYDIKKNECQQLHALPYPVSAMATVKWAENVVIIGGADKDDKALNNVIIYNMKTGNSHMLPPMLHKRKGCMAVVIENTIVVLGGRDERGNHLKSVESFNFERFSWEELPEMKEARYQATAVVI